MRNSVRSWFSLQNGEDEHSTQRNSMQSKRAQMLNQAQNEADVDGLGLDSMEALKPSNNPPQSEIAVKVDVAALVRIVAVVDGGGLLCKRRGRAGANPGEDSIPWFRSQQRWFYLLWGTHLPSQDHWKIIYSADPLLDSETRAALADGSEGYDRWALLQEDFDAGAIKGTLKSVPLADVTDVLLEVAPSSKFRLYLRQGEVLELEPMPPRRSVAEQWVEAIYVSHAMI